MYVIFVIGISVTEFLPPRIFPEEKELSVRSSDNVTLRCEGKSPLTWAYPNDTTVITFSYCFLSPIKINHKLNVICCNVTMAEMDA